MYHKWDTKEGHLMDSLEPKKLALLRIWQILKEHSDIDHPLTQVDIAEYLDKDYGIVIERKAIGRNLALLKEADIDIASTRNGVYLESRDFEDSELHMLIDGVLSSKHITAAHSKDLIERICKLSNRYFRFNVRHIHSVNEWSKTDNKELFYNIELVDEAIESQKQIHYEYNKYGKDKVMRKTSEQTLSPYLMLLHNQRYYLMGYNEKWKGMCFHRLDHITNMTITDDPETPINSLPGYENGINYKEISSSLPYMYTDKPVRIKFIADAKIIDQIVDWFGTEITISEHGEGKVMVTIKSSPNAVEYWALQYVNYVEVISPESLRNKIKDDLENAVKKYN